MSLVHGVDGAMGPALGRELRRVERVAFVLRTGSLGGAEIQALRAARALVDRGVSVALWVLPGSAVAVRGERLGLEVVGLAAGPIAVARAQSVELLHVHEPRDLLWALVAASAARRPVVVTRHLAAHARPRHDPYHRALAERAQFVVASAYVRGTVAAAYGIPPERIAVVRYGYAPPRADAPPLPREALGAPQGVPIVGMLSRLSRGKHLEDALRALKRLREMGTDAHLVVAGEETDRGVRQALLATADGLGLRERVRLLGFQSDVPALIRAFDVLLHTAHAESFGLAILEAMAEGKPVVAVNGGGVPELVRDGETGWLAPPGDADLTARFLAMVLRDSALALQMASAARAVASRLTPEREAAGLAAVYGRQGQDHATA